MAVELWDGYAWNMLKNYTNSQGDIHWTTQVLDISAYSGLTFKIRFRAYGDESEDINNWNIDNILVEAEESQSLSGECVLGYNFYVNSVLCGATPDTFFQVPYSFIQYGNFYNACVATVYGSGNSALDCYSFTSRYLPPPTNLYGTNNLATACLSWNMPATQIKNPSSPKSGSPGLIGYIIYRDGIVIDSIKNADTLHYSDAGLSPGTYSYKVTAVYDLTSYGHPGYFSQSYPAGPVSVDIVYGHLLPFLETWDQANFNYNNWTIEPDTGNWSINATLGNPSPSARFSWNPPTTNYSYSLVSTVLDATSQTCSNIWLNFDYRLLNDNSTGNEKLDVEVLYNNTWHELTEFSNTGSTYWISNHLDITPVKGKTFRLRFRASGKNSQDIVNWNIDNINVYGVCKPPENLVAESSGENVLLTWSSPVCEDGYPLQEGFEEADFPPDNWTQIITNNNNITWEQTSINNPAGVHSGLHAAGVIYDYSHQDEWLIANNIQITGDLTFWSYAFQGSTHLDHYYVKISNDQGAHWKILLDMSALPPYLSPTGYNEWSVPYTVNLSLYLGQVANIAWQAVDGDGQGLWYLWLIDDCAVGSKKLLLSNDTSFSTGYSVFRQDGYGDFNLITSHPVYDTSYLDQGLVTNIYHYYVTAYNTDCSFRTSSDTVLSDLITGISINANQFLKIFPNPANDVITIQSSCEITAIDVFNYIGQKLIANSGLSVMQLKLDVSAFRPGIYFFRIKAANALRTIKVSIIH